MFSWLMQQHPAEASSSPPDGGDSDTETKNNSPTKEENSKALPTASSSSSSSNPPNATVPYASDDGTSGVELPTAAAAADTITTSKASSSAGASTIPAAPTQSDALDKKAPSSTPSDKKKKSSTSSLAYVQDLWKRAMRYDEESFIYSLRIAVAMFVSSLFTLVNPGDFVFPQTPWILASTAVVGWQNTLDTATAVKRAIERTVGTFIGAVIGLAVGFISLPLQYSKPGQATLLGFTTVAFCFFMPYFTANVGLRGSYAARLCLVAYVIISLSFYTSNEPCHPPGWYMGVWRAINIMLGCFIGAASLVIHPRSMKGMIVKRVRTQVKTVGESTYQVLETACQSFTAHHDNVNMAHWDDMLTAGTTTKGGGGGTDVAKFETDPAYLAYIKGAHGWRDCNELFAMLKYDHTLLSMTKDEKREFQQYMTIISHRVFRMHTNLVVLASIVRGASASIAREMRRSSITASHKNATATESSMDAAFQSLRDIGQRIKVLLDSNQEPDDRNQAFTTLVSHDLLLVGQLVSQEQEESVRRRHDQMAKGKDGNGSGMDEALEQLQGMLLSRFDVASRQRSPLEHIESHQQVSLFFLLVEHLIIRATCLYQLLKPELYDK